MRVAHVSNLLWPFRPPLILGPYFSYWYSTLNKSKICRANRLSNRRLVVKLLMEMQQVSGWGTAQYITLQRSTRAWHSFVSLSSLLFTPVSYRTWSSTSHSKRPLPRAFPRSAGWVTGTCCYVGSTLLYVRTINQLIVNQLLFSLDWTCCQETTEKWTKQHVFLASKVL